MAATPRTIAPLVLWDADCAFCSRAASAAERFVVDARPYQSVDLRLYGLTDEQCAQALHVVDRESGQIYVGSDAVARILRTGRGGWPLLGRMAATNAVRPVAQFSYRLVARNRHRLPGGTAACATTPIETRR